MIQLLCRLLSLPKSTPLSSRALESAIIAQLAPGEQVLRWAIVEVRDDAWIIEAGIKAVL